PVEATVYELEALRCNLCGEVFTAPPPAGVGTEKYDASAVGMVALLKYGSGIPFYRLQKLESHLGIPLAPATQWQLVSEAAVMLANCIAHARRHFVDVVNSFPSECRYVLETLREVFHFDVLAKEQGLTPQERLLFHQQNSRPLMDGLHQWCKQQFEERKVEPN